MTKATTKEPATTIIAVRTQAPDFNASRFDDPRYEFVFRAQPGETVEGYCARRAVDRAVENRALKAENERLKEQLRLIYDAIQAGRLVDPDRVQITYKPIHLPELS